MLTPEENDLLCRVGPGAPMGKMLRRYWIPAVRSDDLAADGAPRRVRVLGEDLVAFRGSDGRVGLLDENCPHRGASLVLARNEACGLRCLYHGWKIDAGGRVLETPAEPDELNFKDRVRATAYPNYESGGFVWAYLGPPGTEPPRCDFAFTALPASHVLIATAREECNFVQALEGVLDSAHSNYLHSKTIKPASGVAASVFKGTTDLDVARPSNDGAPRLEVQNTPYGFRYGAIRKPTVDAEHNRYVRVSLFAAPFHTLTPAPSGWGFIHIFVPIDDEHTMFHWVRYNADEPIDAAARERHLAWSATRKSVDLDDEYRKVRTKENNWLQDRDAMRSGESFSGITGNSNEDFAVQESMGPLYDRSKEHLGASDVAIIRMRRLLLDAVRQFDTTGEAPLGLREPVDYGRLQAEEKMIPHDVPWQTVGAFAGEPTAPETVR